MTAYPDLASCPEPPDLAVVAVPAPLVAGVIDQAGRLGVRAVCVISAGFAEVGGEGRALQDELRRRARVAGARLLGPNCMGLLNGGPDPRFNATFSLDFPPPGRLAFVTQSGGLGLAALTLLTGPSLGVSGFVSVGNTADLTPNDLLLYWDDDPATHLILAYLESVPDPRRFARAARRVSRHKPIVVVKAGRTSAGRRAASSHTAAMAAGEVAVEALFHQAGVIRAGTLKDMFDVAAVLSAQPVPAGRRVAVLTNGGGPGILVADACEAAGLLVPELSDGTQAALRAGLPPEAATGNPVDMVASASAEQYGRLLRLLGAAEEIDAIIAVFIPPFLTRAEDAAREIAAAAADLPGQARPRGLHDRRAASGQPGRGRHPHLHLPRAGRCPARADRAVGGMAGPARGPRRDTPGIDPHRGRVAANKVLAGQPGGGWADAAAAAELLAAYGIPAARSRLVRTPAEAAAAQAELGGPVAVKIAAAIHKSDVGGVALGIDSPQAAAEAVTAIRATLAEAGIAEHAGEFLVQEQIRDGVEMIVGVSHDPAFGPWSWPASAARRLRSSATWRCASPRSATPTSMRCSAHCAPTGCSPATARPRRWTWPPSPNSCTGSATWSKTSPRSQSSTSTRYSSASTAPSPPTSASALPVNQQRGRTAGAASVSAAACRGPGRGPGRPAGGQSRKGGQRALPAGLVPGIAWRSGVREMPGIARREPRGAAGDVFSRFDRMFDEWAKMMPSRAVPSRLLITCI